MVAVTFADRAPGSSPPRTRIADVETSPGAGPAFDYRFATSAVGPGFFEAFDRPIVAGRAFHGGDFSPAARTVIVNEAFVRGFRQRGGTRLADRQLACGIPMRSRLPSANGARGSRSSASCATSAWTLTTRATRRRMCFTPRRRQRCSPLVMSVRVRGNPATLVARLPVDRSRCRCRSVRPRSAAARRMDSAAGSQRDHVGRSTGGSHVARIVSVGDGDLFADVRQRVAADARNRAARGAWRRPTPCARRNPVAARWC